MTRRRELLATGPNPFALHDGLVEMAGATADGTVLRIRFVPDRLTLDPASLPAWLARLDGTAEAVAIAALDDLNNELVPRWVEVAVDRHGPIRHRVVLEDRQPGWDNPHLLARMHPPGV